MKKVRQRQNKEEARRPGRDEDKDVAAGAERFTVGTEGTEEEAAEIL